MWIDAFCAIPSKNDENKVYVCTHVWCNYIECIHWQAKASQKKTQKTTHSTLLVVLKKIYGHTGYMIQRFSTRITTNKTRNTKIKTKNTYKFKFRRVSETKTSTKNKDENMGKNKENTNILVPWSAQRPSFIFISMKNLSKKNLWINELNRISNFYTLSSRSRTLHSTNPRAL